MSDHLFVRKFRQPAAVVALSSLALLLTLGCGSDDPTPPSGNSATIQGTVTAAGAGVLNAEVVLSGAASRTETTDGVGAYTFSELPAGDYTVSISLPAGYELADGESATREASVTAGGTTTISWTADTDLVIEVVQLQAESFVPPTMTVSPGTTVRWVVQAGVHTITPTNSGQAGAWGDPGDVSAGDGFEHTFTERGEAYPCHCLLAPAQGLTGSGKVQGRLRR